MRSVIHNTLQQISWNFRKVSFKLTGGRRLDSMTKLALRLEPTENTMPANSVKIRANQWLKMKKTAKKCKNSYVFDKKRGSKTSTKVENVRQISFSMQNKPKVKYAQINLSSFLTSKYE